MGFCGLFTEHTFQFQSSINSCNMHAQPTDLLCLSVGVADTEVKAADLPASEVVDEDRLGTNVAVNKMDTVVKKAETFNNLQFTAHQFSSTL